MITLELSPDEEQAVQKYASETGVSAVEYARHLFARALQEHAAPLPLGVPADDPILHFLHAHLQEAEAATPAEKAAADAEWNHLQRALNETRRANGERLRIIDTKTPPAGKLF